MERRAAQRGEGKVGLIIALFVVGIAVFLGLKIIPVRINAYEFRDVIREECRYGAVRHDDAAVASSGALVAASVRKSYDLELFINGYKAGNEKPKDTAGDRWPATTPYRRAGIPLN